jgi:hypothetical protein
MKSYRTGFFALDDSVPARIAGSGWSVYFDATDEANECRARVVPADQFRPLPTMSISTYPSGNIIPASEITIAARSRIAAQRALNLIQACCGIIAGEVLAFYEDAIAIPSDPNDPEDIRRDEQIAALRNQSLGAPGLGHACSLAAKVSRRRNYQYAVHKLFLSFRTASAAIVDLDPAQGLNRFRADADPAALVAFASAVTLAFSAIEELQLESRGSTERPSSRPDGSWHPDRLAELEARLVASRIDTTELIAWTERGGVTRIERARVRPQGQRFNWATGPVRDRDVPITDALRAASWLRSKVTTHKFAAETRSLKLYDVHNVQFLARRLVLESMRSWPP